MLTIDENSTSCNLTSLIRAACRKLCLYRRWKCDDHSRDKDQADKYRRLSISRVMCSLSSRCKFDKDVDVGEVDIYFKS